MEHVTVIKPGLLTTIQDLGRPNYRKYGVSVSGVMDPFSFRLGNLLVGNDENAAAIEVTLVGPSLHFGTETVFSLTGGNLDPKLNNKEIPMWTVIHAKPGDILSFGKYKFGCRTYIALAGGIDVPKVMDSRSTFLRGNFGGLNGRALKRDDQFFLGGQLNKEIDTCRRLRSEDIPNFETKRPVRFIIGPHIQEFEENSLKKFLTTKYTLSNASDRMGYRLDGEILKHKGHADIISDFITMGTIQVPGSGQPIVHMADCGTSGGYTKIGVVITADLPYLAQLKPGDALYFEEVSVEDAQLEKNKIEKIVENIKLHNKMLL